MFSRCEPYEHEDLEDVIRKVSQSKGNPDMDYRPGIPPGCPSFVAKLMQSCWATTRSMRPTFDKIADQVKSMEISG
jgi:hypothetical protein